MRESPPTWALRQTASPNIVRAIGLPITFAASALFNAANPPDARSEDPQGRPSAVAKEQPGMPRNFAEDRMGEQFEAIALEMEENIRLLNHPEYPTREKGQRKLMESARQLFRSMNPLPMHVEARWRKMMDFRSAEYTLEQRVRLKNIFLALEYEGLFLQTRVPLEPDATMEDVLETLEKQTGVKLRFPPAWKDFKQLLNRIRGKNAIPFARLLLESCRAGNFIPVLEADGVTITFRENTNGAQVFLEENMLCVLERVDNKPEYGERLGVFPDPQESIASVEHVTTVGERKMLVEAHPIGLRPWTDESQSLAPRKLKEIGGPGCFDTEHQPANNTMVDIRAAILRDRRTWEVPLDDNRKESGIQAIQAKLDRPSRTITVSWRSTDPFDSPQICWSEMPVAANEYEGVDAEGKPIKATASPIVYHADNHAFSVQLQCERIPKQLRVRGYRSLTPYDNHEGEHFTIQLPFVGPIREAVLPVPPLPEPNN